MQAIRTLLLLATTSCLLVTGSATADGSITLSTGRVDPSADGFGSTTTVNVRFANEILDVGAAELDLDVEAAKETSSGDAPNGNEYDFTSLGVGLSARTAGPLYLIGRYGIARNEIDVSGGDKTTENQQSIGIGAGGSLGIVQLEVMATRHLEEGDLEDITWITAGVRF